MEGNEHKEIGNIRSIILRNLGTINKNQVTLTTNKGTITLVFSYETLVGFYSPIGTGCLINYWSTTTGKLLNEIEPDKKQRLNQKDFNKLLNKAFMSIGLSQDIKVGQ